MLSWHFGRRVAIALMCLALSGWVQAELRVSQSPQRTGATPLQGAELSGIRYIFYSPSQPISRVEFFLDQDSSGTRWQREGVAPYDFTGTASNGDSNPYGTGQLSNATHFITALVTPQSGEPFEEVASFSVNNDLLGDLVFAQPSVSYVPDAGTSQLSGSYLVAIEQSPGTVLPISVSSDRSWLQLVDGVDAFTETPSGILLDLNGLVPGTYQATLTASASGYQSAQKQVSLTVSGEPSGYQLWVSASSDRSDAVLLAGQALAGEQFVFVLPEQGIDQVRFFLDETDTNTTPFQRERRAPFDFAGTAGSLARPFDVDSLTQGAHSILAEISTATGVELVNAGFTIGDPILALVASPASVSLQSDADVGILSAKVFISGSDGTAPSFSVDTNVGGGLPGGAGGSLDTTTSPASYDIEIDTSGVSPGSYQADYQFIADGYVSVSVPVSLIINDPDGPPPVLQASTGSLSFSSAPGQGVISQSFSVSRSDGEAVSASAVASEGWLTPQVDNGVMPSVIEVMVDTDGLAAGSYSDVITVSAPELEAISVAVSLVIQGAGGGDDCAPVVCAQIKVALPYRLDFDQARGGLNDRNGNGTGFTYLLPTSRGDGYLPGLLDLDTSIERLIIQSTKGLQHLGVNSLDNAVGVGFAGPNQIARISTQLVDTPSGTDKYEQAGLWFGFSEDHYVKLVVVSTSGVNRVEMLYEWEGVKQSAFSSDVGDLSSATLELVLFANPNDQTLHGRFSINGGSEVTLAVLDLPSEFFSFDAAGIDPIIGTRTFTGLMTSHRNSDTSLAYTFEYFEVREAQESELGSGGGGGGGGGSGGGGEPVSSANQFRFDKIHTHSLDFPAAMTWGPNGKLYVAEAFGVVHELTFDSDWQVISDITINSMVELQGPQLTLGITSYHDNPSDPDDFSLWLNHSNASFNDGAINSGAVTRLSGEDFANAETVISGLPRAKANHGPNSLHFGPDNRLYLAIGGITGAGAAVDPAIANTEFGDRAEQPLSAAILVADVFAPGFDGSCDNSPDIFGPNPCDVEAWATGLRNSYDFVFHRQGEVFATDNGLGVTGAFPPSPTPDCSGFGDPAPVAEGGNNPGTQQDLLLRLSQGGYYGHPNPSRDECVFKDGSDQGVAPLPAFEPPTMELGKNLSANGIIEYTGDRACGLLNGDLLYTAYSKNDGVYRVRIGADGSEVLDQQRVFVDLVDPLVLAERDGYVAVGEFGSNQIAILELNATGCWLPGSDAPQQLLDPASALLNGSLHIVGGKTSSGHVTAHYAYDVDADSWRTLAAKPGDAVENAALAAFDGALYLFGGSTGPFNGARSEAYRFDPGSNSWNAIAAMPVALGGIRAEVIGDEILIAGGMNDDGASVNSLLIYTPATDSWRVGLAMPQARDNPGTAVLGGELYVMGGRERLADGTTLDGTLASMSIYDPASDSWRSGADMVEGRRTFAVSTVNGRIQVVGGEIASGAPEQVFTEVEEYDPDTEQWQVLSEADVPTHGSGFATHQNALILVVGGPSAGSSYSAATYQILFN
ncbi:Kelch repeat-containing protein [Ferrimonas pelagia]|uniref:N-acetylneuraminic acid mutarotase n=1 Tax=Ferrimonas pelagia TaxID=1177826 RepID=A0ABP9F8Y1_9GAMM